MSIEFVKWTSTDAEGEFSHIGMVTLRTEDRIEFITSPTAGSMSVPLDEGTFETVPKPRTWGKKIIAVGPQQIKKPKAPKEYKAIKPGSKKQLALDLYKSMMEDDCHPARKDVINTFVTELDMTPAGASTYAAMCKKEHTNG